MNAFAYDQLKKIFGSNAKSIEILAVLNDKKPCARMGFYDEELAAIKEFCQTNGLFLEISDFKVAMEGDKYSNKGKISDFGINFVYISKNALIAKNAKNHEKMQDHENLGLLLGYPSCCISFFIEHQDRLKFLDNDYADTSLRYSVGNEFPYANNILLKENDICLLSHFPCSLNCEFSKNIGISNFKLLSAYDKEFASFLKEKLTETIIKDGKEFIFK